MEAVSCVKGVILAAVQYKNNRNDDSLLHLHRQLDVLISITKKGSSLVFLHPKQLLSTECITCLVEIMNDPQTKTSTAHKTMTLLSNFANASYIREFFHTTFDLTSVLINYLRSLLSHPLDENIILCVRLLQKLTYKAEIQQDFHVRELVDFLIQQIVEVNENNLTEWCLGLLANLCRNNPSIRAFIKGKTNAKAVFKKLMYYLSHQSQKVEVFAISTISSLCLDDDIGKRIFCDQNVRQVFQLLFNILHSGEPGMTQQYAVDVFNDIIQYEKIQESLIKYSHLVRCLQQILLLLTTAESSCCALILELLLGFCQVRELRSVICSLIMESMVSPSSTPFSSHESDVSLSMLMSNRQTMSPYFALICWSCQPVDCHETIQQLALEVLHIVYEATFNDELKVEKTSFNDEEFVLVPVLSNILSFSVPLDNIFTKKLLQQKLDAVRLLKTLSGNDLAFSRLLQRFDFKMLHGIVEQQFATNRIRFISSIEQSSRMEDPSDSAEIGLDLALAILDLILILGARDDQYREQLHTYLLDQRMIPFLAYGLTSNSSERIKIALKLTVTATSMASFNLALLSVNMSWLNTAEQSSRSFNQFTDKLPASSSSSSSNIPKKTSSSALGISSNALSLSSIPLDLDSSVQLLIDRMQNGLELKDIRSSELIAIYEHRLQSLQMKENSLQDLLEAKTQTLVQSDRLLAQFRLRMAQYEDEGHKLRSLLQESERCKEAYEEKLETEAAKCEELHVQLEHIAQENARLEEISVRYQQLVQDFGEQGQRLDTHQRALKVLKQEHESLVEMHEMLKRHHETLRHQHDKASKMLAELEEERNLLNSQLKDKEAKINETSKLLLKTEENLRKRTSDCDELEVAVDKLRVELSKTEQSKKELQHQVSSLEVVCRQRETSIRDKDLQLAQLKGELDKHTQLAALIHSLSGGTGPGKAVPPP